MSAKRTDAQASDSWWSSRRNRMRLWTALAVAGIVVLGAVLWVNNRAQDSSSVMNDGSVPIGTRVNAVNLEDSRTGQMFDLGQYLGKKDIVLVAYMGDFCLGCRELIAELQRRAPEFDAANAQLVVLGYEVGQVGRDTASKRGVTSYPLLQEGAPYTFTRSLGLWSDMMAMPFMGYVVIDKTGKLIAGQQTSLSEAKGAAPANVDQLLDALAKARLASLQSSPGQSGSAASYASGSR